MFLQRLLLVCIIFNSTVIVSCSLSCPDALEYVTFENMGVTNLKMEGVQSWLEVEGAELVEWENFKIECELSGTFHAQNHQHTNGNGLYALSCPRDGDLGSKDGISRLSLIVLTDYNERFKANDSLNSIVRVNTSKSSSQFEESLADFVEVRSNHLQENHFYLSLNEAPSQQDFQQFKIVLELENGDVLESKTDKVNLSR